LPGTFKKNSSFIEEFFIYGGLIKLDITNNYIL